MATSYPKPLGDRNLSFWGTLADELASRVDLAPEDQGTGLRARLSPPAGCLGGGLGSGATPQGREAASYLDSPAKSISDEPRCPGWFVLGICEDGHTWAKETFCGREWCEKCRDDSQGRRVGRWFPKVQQLKRMGYLVVTIPPEDRWRGKADLVDVGRIATAVVRQVWARGLRRWHWFGDDHGQGREYHPHLNFLVGGGPVTKRELRELRWELQRALLLSRLPVINYQWTDKPGKMMHLLKYVTRATFLERAWDAELAEELHGLRNCWQWGKWDGPPAWTLPEAELVPAKEAGELEALGKLEEGRCPLDGKRITWGAVRSMNLLGPGDVRLPGGYWLIGGASPGPPGLP